MLGGHYRSFFAVLPFFVFDFMVTGVAFLICFSSRFFGLASDRWFDPVLFCVWRLVRVAGVTVLSFAYGGHWRGIVGYFVAAASSVLISWPLV